MAQEEGTQSGRHAAVTGQKPRPRLQAGEAETVNALTVRCAEREAGGPPRGRENGWEVASGGAGWARHRWKRPFAFPRLRYKRLRAHMVRKWSGNGSVFVKTREYWRRTLQALQGRAPG